MASGTPIVLWEIQVTDRNREKGSILADAKDGAVRRVILPEGRQAPR